MGESEKRRDYTNEIIATTVNDKFKYIVRETETKPKRKRKTNKVKILILLLVFIPLGIITSFIFFGQVSKSSNPIPKNIQQSAAFNLYYPSKLPGGYSINKNSFSQTGSVVAYYADNKHGGRIFFSIQPLPDAIAIDDFNNRVLQNKVDVISNIGKATVGTFNEKVTGSVTTTESWILVSTNDDALKTAIADILSSLKRGL
jgi:hypothetical protein